MKTAKIMLFVAMLVLSAASVSALPAIVGEVSIDGVELVPNAENRLDVQRGEQFEVRLELVSPVDLAGMELQGFISGYEFNDVAEERMHDYLPMFDMRANTIYVKKLQLVLPADMDVDKYKLRIMLSDRDGSELIDNYNLYIDTSRHLLRVDDVTLNPHSSVKAGSAILATVRVENGGQKDEEDVKVTFRLPKLNLEASDFIDAVDSGDEEESEELFVRIPACAAPGVYDAEFSATYADGHRTTSVVRKQISITAGSLCGGAGQESGAVAMPSNAPSASLVLGSQLETVESGASAVFPVTFANTGRDTRSFTLTAGIPAGFGVRVSPTSTVVLKSGQSATLYLFVTPKESTPAGVSVFTATLSSGQDILSQAALTVNVIPADGWSVLDTLLVMLVIMLVVMGILLGVSWLRSDRRKTEPYY